MKNKVKKKYIIDAILKMVVYLDVINGRLNIRRDLQKLDIATLWGLFDVYYYSTQFGENYTRDDFPKLKL